jgi:D-psicose/D-tagatose/L-ribulose 3-epimerase
MRRLGIHAFVWTGSSVQADLERAMEQTSEAGYRLIEFPRLDPRKFDVPAMARRAQALDLEIVVTMGLPFAADISSHDEKTVAAGEAVLSEAISVARDLGANKLGGIIFSAHGKYNALPSDRGRKNSIAAIAKAAEKGKAAGVSLNLEIVNRFETNLLNTTAQGLAYMGEVGSDNVFLHLDTFHMNIEEANPAEAIRLAGDRIGYFHIGESNRGYLGDGVIDFERIFDALVAIDYRRDITFESFSSEVVDEDLSITCAIWRNTWKDNVPLAKHAKSFIETKFAEAGRRAATNQRP